MLLQTAAVLGGTSKKGQSDSSVVQVVVKKSYAQLDSEAIARRLVIRDSLKAIGDSLSYLWIRAPNPERPNLFIDSLVKLYKVEKLDFAAWAKKFAKKTEQYKGRYNEGKSQPKGEKWIMAVLLLLVFFFGMLKKVFSKELVVIIQSFYSNRVLSQINKEDSLFNSWPFIFLYILFGLTIGMFLYLASKYYHFSGPYTGFEWFLILSASVIVLFTLKVIILRMVGFFFGIEKMLKVYISILYLSYFNAAIVFLPIVIALSLAPHRYSEILGCAAILILAIIFAFQFIRAGANILSTYQFPKVYLFLYLCALEICPLLILIKVLRF